MSCHRPPAPRQGTPGRQRPRSPLTQGGRARPPQDEVLELRPPPGWTPTTHCPLSTALCVLGCSMERPRPQPRAPPTWLRPACSSDAQTQLRAPAPGTGPASLGPQGFPVLGRAGFLGGARRPPAGLAPGRTRGLTQSAWCRARLQPQGPLLCARKGHWCQGAGYTPLRRQLRPARNPWVPPIHPWDPEVRTTSPTLPRPRPVLRKERERSQAATA